VSIFEAGVSPAFSVFAVFTGEVRTPNKLSTAFYFLPHLKIY
jgi:hypothetical protein